MGLARDERARLADLFTEVGPDAPTLCEGWRTKDLAAHLVIRERRPDTAVGIVVKPLAGYTERVLREYAAKPFPQLVELVRTGPPRLSPTSIGAVDELVNGAEFFVHHEDVRRGAPGWTPREPDPARDDTLWRVLSRMAKLSFRSSPVGIALHRPSGEEIAAKRGPDTVTVTGEPGELVMFAFGRDEAKLDFEGDQAAIARVQGLKRGI
ncbi:TIGR03085 family metal-binding protein [Labedaea rhizosphaerae]|uniref:Uncharacterized protein (TIGR03085 family) n=1 Tax=Labedaea rhizosphaerae TaxID=598644 RepID=A0A4R6SDZ4_LABRH|nr:TIGR03085 family metal-binding protein [Labedaea rhizosphaerae]TDP97266.1 uncharacterized protein (TIGR03085 family) [Labedaea rhizosphaerae]